MSLNIRYFDLKKGIYMLAISETEKFYLNKKKNN